MTFRLTLGILLVLHSGVTFAQPAEKTALRNIEKHRWQKAEAKLRKALSKDAVNPSIRYVLSVFYFRPDNPAYDLDSAYHYAVSALDDYTLTPERERDRLRRIPLDSTGLVALLQRIDSAAFEVARNANTEEAYIRFLNHFPHSAQRDLAEELRDEVAYVDALKQNTYQAFYSFLERYPKASRAPDARSRYDRLLYVDHTKDKRLNSYVSFLAAHPETPYVGEIYQHIFEISTADGKAESFFTFMDQYPRSGLAERAGQMAFHILAEDGEAAWPEGFLSDSLQDLRALEKLYLIPVLRHNRYGFIDENGREVLAPQFDSIPAGYLCGPVTDDVLMADNKLIARNGSVIHNGSADAVDPMGIGFLKLTAHGRVSVVHKAGFVVADSLQDARVLSKRFLALKKFDSWFLYTLTGKLLDANPWDDILSFKDVVVFKTGKKVFLARKEQLGTMADGNTLELSAAFDEAKLWPHDLIWVKEGQLQGVVDQGLQPVVRLDQQTLAPAFFGISAEEPGGFALYNWVGQKASGFSGVNISGQWVAVRKRDAWLLFDPRFQQIESKPYDTMRIEGPFVIGQRTDTVYVHFTGNRVRMFTRPVNVSFIPGMDTTSFLLVQD
ncbi:MAG TPA: WG repeat-containing protein, partial [Chryseosolibacter sp.]